MRLPCLKLAASVALSLGSASAFAGILSIDTDTATAGNQAANTINLDGTRDVALIFNRADANDLVNSVSGTISFDTAAFDVTVAVDDQDVCQVNDGAGTIAFIDLNFANFPDNDNICTFTFTETGGAAGDVEAITLSNVAPAATTLNNGQLTIQDAPVDAPTVSFAPTNVNIPSGGGAVGDTSDPATIVVTATGGTAPATASYDCGAQPAGFQVTNLSNGSIAVGSNPADMVATCTLGNAATQAVLTCTRTGGDTSSVDITLNCPAGDVVAPDLNPTPAEGTTLNCSGNPGDTTTASVTIDNDGDADATGVTCSTSGNAGFAIQQQPSGTIAQGDSSTVTVACTVPAEGLTINGTLTCDSTNAGALAFPLTASGVAAPIGSSLETIPSTSLWAKIGLIGLLAALGALVVGFRRHS